MQTIRGRAWKFGHNINTDLIVPARFLHLPYEELGPHALAGVDPDFANKVKPGDLVVAGDNFGGGSSREAAPIALKRAGVGAVIATYFARIFFRNAINVGLAVLECPQARRIREGDELEVEVLAGTIRNLTCGETYEATKFPREVLAIVEAGGLLPYLRQTLGVPPRE
ncbi:MAG: 3-isopropylmalate dehydratase small subunit [Armatimonadetes bacterium]|nr:3-isopropylmalate dehydratase small subunit [Armatimonadota bacterium]